MFGYLLSKEELVDGLFNPLLHSAPTNNRPDVPPLWFDKLTTNGEDPFALSLSKACTPTSEVLG